MSDTNSGRETKRLVVKKGDLSITLPTEMDLMAVDPQSFILNSANQLIENSVTEYINIDTINMNPAKQTIEEKEPKVQKVVQILTDTKKEIEELLTKIETMKKLSFY